jgi:hypothetical protein
MKGLVCKQRELLEELGKKQINVALVSDTEKNKSTQDCGCYFDTFSSSHASKNVHVGEMDSITCLDIEQNNRIAIKTGQVLINLAEIRVYAIAEGNVVQRLCLMNYGSVKSTGKHRRRSEC